jgi:hypothetical protein
MKIFDDLPEKLKAKLSRSYHNPALGLTPWHLDLTDFWFTQHDDELFLSGPHPKLSYVQLVLDLYSQIDHDWGCICLIPLQNGRPIVSRFPPQLDHCEWTIDISGTAGPDKTILVNATAHEIKAELDSLLAHPTPDLEDPANGALRTPR